jgi:lipid-A-disaccharide synthase
MAERPVTIAFALGEQSGDSLAAGLMEAIRRQRPAARFVGLAGARMQAHGMDSLYPVSDLTAMGFVGVAAQLPRIVRRGHELIDALVAWRPDVLVIVDNPDFNHAIARRLARRAPDTAIVNYVSPSVWAWRPWRARRMARYVDHVLALLPFEPQVHARLGGPPCSYVGHPLIEEVDRLRAAPGERPPLSDSPVLLVLPGSRRSEVERLMEPFGRTVARLASEFRGLEVVLPAVPHLADDVRRLAARWPVAPRIVVGEADKLAAFRRAHAALAASGTVTLELALAGVPMVVAYRVEPLVRPFKFLLGAPSIVLANLVIGRKVIPEFLDAAASPKTLAENLQPLLADSPARARQLDAFARLDEQMRLDNCETPSERAARIVLQVADSGPGPRTPRPRAAGAQRRLEIGT